jgi:hypothetical protein
MKSRRLLLFLFLLAIPGAVAGEVIRLTDGSAIKGRLVSVSEDSVVFRTSFGARIAVSRSQVRSIVFGDPANAPELLGSTRAAAEAGSLLVACSGLKLSSKIVVHRERGKDSALRANAIEEALYVDGEKVFSYVDSTVDKIVRDGPDKIYKNTIELKDVKIGLGVGPHVARLVVRNLGYESERGRFDHGPLDKQLSLYDIMIFAGKTTRKKVGIKKSRLGLGGYKLVVETN